MGVVGIVFLFVEMVSEGDVGMDFDFDFVL